MNRGVDRREIFLTDRDRVEFCQLLIATSERFDLEVHGYCLLANHFHLLVRCPEGRLSAAMQWLTSLYAQGVNERWGRVGHLFGGRFASRLLTTHRYIVNVLRYVHRNALDVPGVRSVDAYRWSAHRAYLGFRRADWVHTEPLLTWLEGPTGYRRFVAGAEPTGRASGASHRPPTATEILDTVDLVVSALRTTEDVPVRRLRRAAALTVAGGYGVEKAVASELEIPSTNALKTARSRARSFVGTDAVAADTVRRVRLLLGTSDESAAAA